jgi:CheY-like chemotaxis protein
MARVLIVEDEEQVRVLAESYLREQGHRTLSAASPVEALPALGVADGIDLLFADIGLREDPHGGLDLAKEARRRKPDLKVLYVTGQAVTDGMKANDGRPIGAVRETLHCRATPNGTDGPFRDQAQGNSYGNSYGNPGNPDSNALTCAG